jgi:hypothetical protein
MDPPERRRMPAGKAIAVMASALMIASLFGADSLTHLAEQQRFGTRRDIALAVAHPLQRVSDDLYLNRPRRWLADASGHDDLTEKPDLAEAAAGHRDPDRRETGPPAGAVTTTTATTSTTVAPTTTTTPPHRTPAADAPLKVWTGGDSLMGNVAQELGRAVAEDSRIRMVAADVRIGTGLARPDVLDWPSTLRQELDQSHPDVVVLMFGGNDDQDMVVDGHRYVIGKPEWQTEYQRRVAQVLDAAGADDRTVVWLGMPPVRPDRLNRIKDAMNAAAQAEIAHRPNVHYVDTGAVLAPNGYTDFLPNASGNPVRVREPDGVHPTHAGAARLAPAIIGTFAAEWHLS